MSGRFSTLVQLVTDLVFSAAGAFTGKGADDDDIEGTVGWNFGFYSRPNDGARGVVVKLGGRGNHSILVAYRDKQYELSLEKGECGMKNAFDATVLLNKQGEIVLNGGGNKVARVGDHGNVGTLTLTLTGTTALSGTYVDPDGASTPVTSGTPITLKAKISEGAPKVLG
jgi:phage gp45-like